MTEDEIKYHNRLWYYKTYNQLIEKCLSRGLDKSKLDYPTEYHHILPHCLGGNDDDTNMVLVTIREHILLHMLLSSAYPDNFSLSCSVKAMLMNSKFTKERGKYISYVSTRIAAKFRGDFSLLQKGKRLNEEHRRKLSEAKLGKERKPFTESHQTNISKGKIGKPYGTKIIDPNGKLYNTLTECSKVYNIPISTLKFWAEHIPERGFKLYNEDTKEFVKDDSCLSNRIRSIESYRTKKGNR